MATTLPEAAISAVYIADAIPGKVISEHFTIQQLYGMAGTNAFKLNKGFREIFNTAVSGRLLFRRTEQGLSGKWHRKQVMKLLPGLSLHRKKFGMTPAEWREAQRGETEN